MTVSTPFADSSSKSDSGAPKFPKRLARSMVLALLAFAVIPVSLMAIAGYVRSRGMLHDQLEMQIHSIMHNNVELVALDMQTKSIRLDLIARRPGFIESAETLLSLHPRSMSFSEPYKQLISDFDTANRPDNRPLFDDFLLVSPDGNIYAASQTKWHGVSLAENSKYIGLAQNSESIMLYDFAPVLPNQIVIASVYPLKTPEGLDLGFLIGLTESASIQLTLEGITAFIPNSSGYFITTDNNYIHVDNYTHKLDGFIPSAEQKQVLQQSIAPLASQEDGTSPLLELDNQDGTSVVALVHWLPSIGASIVIEVPEEKAFGQLNSLIPFFIILFTLTFVAIFFVIWLGTNRFVNPVLDLVNTTRLFAEGDWLQRAPTERKDELGLLAYTFNKMADELSSLYRSLEHQIDERTDYIRTAAEVAQSIVSKFDLDELLDTTTLLIVERFGYYHAGIFMLDPTGVNASLQAAHGPAAEEMLESGHSLRVGSSSIVGWVAENNQSRAVTDVSDDAGHFKNKLLPETRAEAGIPIAVGNLVLGVLDVQSTTSKAFDQETIIVLQTLANQIATAIQNAKLATSTEVNLDELERLFRASRQITHAQNEIEVVDITARVLQDAPFISAIYTIKNNVLELASIYDPHSETSTSDIETTDTPVIALEKQLGESALIVDLEGHPALPQSLTRMPRQLGCLSAAYFPITHDGHLHSLIMLGARQKAQLSSATIQPYIGMSEMIVSTLDKVKAFAATNRRLLELEAVASTSQAVAAAGEMDTLYPVFHEKVRQILGDHSFVVALYDSKVDTITIPYLYEDGQVSSLDAFPMGEGLSSIIIRTGEPLMLVENTEQRAAALGAKIVGKSAKSWMGVPMQNSGKVIGALIVQDLEHEYSFSEEDLHFMVSLASQASSALLNARLLSDSRQRTIQLQSAAEIARDISGSLHLDELLSNAVEMIRERFDFYHASVFLIDSSGEYAVVRESTGDAGTQLKRSGHKLGVGSQSTVGYVAGSGKPLVLEDTAKDATYYANPLLPDTRAEAAIPMRVGERTLGVLDVQSTQPYTFTEEIVQTLNILADQLAVAVVNTELFAETQEHLSQHRLLQHITTSAASGTTLEEAMKGAVQGLQVTLSGDRVAILMLDKERGELKVSAAVGYSEADIEKMKISVGSGISGWVAANRKLLRINDVRKDSRYIEVSSNTRSELTVPLFYRKDLLGVINVESERVAAYDEADEEMLGTLAGSLAAIIANARLLEQVRRQADRERMLREITSKIRKSTNVQTILATTAGELNKAIGARRAQIKIDIDKNNG